MQINMASFNYNLVLQFSVIVNLLCFHCLSSSLGVESISLNINTDKDALVTFKSLLSSESESSNPFSSWNQNYSPCNWTGVVCNRFGHRVTGINLSGFKLEGTISPHIGNLSFLRSLQLQNNKLTGTLPNEIGNLFRLKVLNMSANSLEGVIPPNITKLNELRVLDLMSNRITGRLPEELDHLRSLNVLNLGKNNLSGAIPPSLANISSLTTLNFGTNNFNGLIPDELGSLPNLKVLDLTINNLTGVVPPSIYNRSSLTHLALASNNLWGEIPYDVGERLPNLLVFNFCINKFTGRIPGSLHNLTNIQVIRMAHNRLHGTIPAGLGNLPFLKMYNIGYNRIFSPGENGLDFITSLTNSTHLNFLAFDGNLIEGVIPTSVGDLSDELSIFFMGANRIYGHIPPSIGNLKSLTLLNMSDNFISGEIPAEIGQLEQLQKLEVARNQITGNIPDSLGNLKKLNDIDLSGNELVGEIPATFMNFQSLNSIDLSNNRLNGNIPKEILNLPRLSTILNLSKNFLEGHLPQEVGLLENVVTIDLSNNHLSGGIPSSFKNCKSLERLLMANNTLSGPIPNSLGEVKALASLDLSSNRLSGSIPYSLQNLQALQYLNLSSNDLQGFTPHGGIFKTMSNVYFEGNPKLCTNLVCENSGGRGKLVKIFGSIAIVIVAASCCIIIGFICTRKRNIKAISSSELMNGKPQMISYDQLRQATGNFNEENLIGKGSFGSVYKGYLREGMAIAVKVLDIDQIGSLKCFHSECEALKNVRHRNLVKLITSCSSLDFKNTEFLALVYEFLSNGSLGEWIHGERKRENGNTLDMVQRLNIAIDVASALDYLHHDCEVPVVHCDIKPCNILLDEDLTAKVGDFGLAKLLMERRGNQSSAISSTNALNGSIGYIPPEYGIGEKPSTAGDVYSFGVMLLELFTRKSPTNEQFLGELSLVSWVRAGFPDNVLQVIDMNLNNHGRHINQETKHECLIKIIGVGLSCTAASPDKRITMRDALCKLKTAQQTLRK